MSIAFCGTIAAVVTLMDLKGTYHASIFQTLKASVIPGLTCHTAIKLPIEAGTFHTDVTSWMTCSQFFGISTDRDAPKDEHINRLDAHIFSVFLFHFLSLSFSLSSLQPLSVSLSLSSTISDLLVSISIIPQLQLLLLPPTYFNL